MDKQALRDKLGCYSASVLVLFVDPKTGKHSTYLVGENHRGNTVYTDPGGKIIPIDASSEVTASRELYEETGILVAPQSLFYPFDIMGRPGTLNEGKVIHKVYVAPTANPPLTRDMFHQIQHTRREIGKHTDIDMKDYMKATDIAIVPFKNLYNARKSTSCYDNEQREITLSPRARLIIGCKAFRAFVQDHIAG